VVKRMIGDPCVSFKMEKGVYLTIKVDVLYNISIKFV
jgi:hypothetical protein